MTVLDSSGAVDYLLGEEAAPAVAEIFGGETAAAPDLITFEVLAVLRRLVLHRQLDLVRGTAAVADLADLPIDLFPSLPLIPRAWDLRGSMTAADAIFVALAEALGEKLATKDDRLARTVAQQTEVELIRLG